MSGQEQSNMEPYSKPTSQRESELLSVIEEKNARIAGLVSNVERLEHELAVAKLPRTRSRPIVFFYRPSFFSALVTALLIILVAPIMLDYFGLMSLQEIHQFYEWLRSVLIRG